MVMAKKVLRMELQYQYSLSLNFQIKNKKILWILFALPTTVSYFCYASLLYVVIALLHAQQHMNKLLLTRITKQRVALGA